jgi:hypothetical protein
MSEAINMHKRIAMGGEGEANHLKKGGKVAKYAKGGSVKKPAEVMWDEPKGKVNAYPEKKSHTLINDSSQKLPYVKPAGKIATMKKGGHAGKPMMKASGRGR